MEGTDQPSVVTTLAGSGSFGRDDGAGAVASFNAPFALSLFRDSLFIADLQNHLIRRMQLASPHSVSTVAGSGRPELLDGLGTAASFNRPAAMAHDRVQLFVADRYNHAIRAMRLDTHSVTTLVGSGAPGLADGSGSNAQFNCPTGLALTADGSMLFVAECADNLT